METFIIRDGGVVCSSAEAKKWEDAGCMPGYPAPGDTVIRFKGSAAPEVGRVGVKAAIDQEAHESFPDTEEE